MGGHWTGRTSIPICIKGILWKKNYVQKNHSISCDAHDFSFPMWISLPPPMILLGSRFTTFGLLIWMLPPLTRVLGQKSTSCLIDPLSAHRLQRNGSLRKQPIKWIKRHPLPMSRPNYQEEHFVQVGGETEFSSVYTDVHFVYTQMRMLTWSCMWIVSQQISW